MNEDPIIAEIRQIRRAYSERFHNDLHAICEDLRRQERESLREFRTPMRQNATRQNQRPSSHETLLP